jgi:hypothetical protein
MSFFLTAVVVGAAAGAISSWAARRVSARRKQAKSETGNASASGGASSSGASSGGASSGGASNSSVSGSTTAKSKKKPNEPSALALASFPLDVGAVITLADGESLFLCSCLTLAEDASVARVLVSSDEKNTVYVLPNAGDEASERLLYLLQSAPSGAFAGLGESPFSLELGGVLFSRRRRLYVRGKFVEVAAAPDSVDIETERVTLPALASRPLSAWFRATSSTPSLQLAEYQSGDGSFALWLGSSSGGSSSEVRVFVGQLLRPGMYDRLATSIDGASGDFLPEELSSYRI